MLIIGHCTNGKSRTAAAGLAGVPTGSITAVGEAWLKQLEQAPRDGAAAMLYQGRSFIEARRAADLTASRHLIVSAGLGLIDAETAVPSYALTVVSGEDNVLSYLTEGDAAAWWHWLSARSPFATSFAEAAATTTGPILIALPSTYLAMVARDLLPLSGTGRLRLFCRGSVPMTLREALMPYDARLDGPDSPLPGTRADFASRALLHFCRDILPGQETEDGEHHAERVRATLADWRIPQDRRGVRHSDEEIVTVMRAHWQAQGGSTAKLLRVFRDDLGIACEQGRFARLARALRVEKTQ